MATTEFLTHGRWTKRKSLRERKRERGSEEGREREGEKEEERDFNNRNRLELKAFYFFIEFLSAAK